MDGVEFNEHFNRKMGVVSAVIRNLYGLHATLSDAGLGKLADRVQAQVDLLENAEGTLRAAYSAHLRYQAQDAAQRSATLLETALVGAGMKRGDLNIMCAKTETRHTEHEVSDAPTI